MNEMLKKINDLYSILYKLIGSNEELWQRSDTFNQMYTDDFNCIFHSFSNIKYEMNDPENDSGKLFFPKFRSDKETLRMMIEEGKSLARFGDGEFGIVINAPRQKFQHADEKLADRIKEVLNSNHPDLLIGIAKQYGNLDRFVDESAMVIREYMTEETRSWHQQLLQSDRIYSDGYITRPYVIFKDRFTEAPAKRFDALKEIWKGKKVIIVEGAQTRLGVGNDLFGDAEIKRILAPATSSFDRYDDILAETLRQAEWADLFLLALGPCAGVLAYDLTLQGHQAIDIGHLDLEYEWFLAGKGHRVPVPYKYNNEVDGGDLVEECHDPVYEMQIAATFL